MKKHRILFCTLLLLLLAACGPGRAEVPAETEEPLRLERLSLEVPRADLSTQDLARTARELPEALKRALAAQGVEAETVEVSVSSSPASTAQAVNEGGVDLAVFTGEDFTALDAPPPLLLTAGDGEEERPYDMAAAVRPDSETLVGEAFAQALAAALNDLEGDYPVFGGAAYTLAGETD